MLLELILLISAVILWNYQKFRQRTRYWSDRGVPVVSQSPNFLLGNAQNANADYVLGRRSKYYVLLDQCKEMAGRKFFGSYGLLCTPTLTVVDLDLVHDILVKDFDHFTDRINRDNPFNPLLSTSRSETDRVWHAMIPFQNGSGWKATRSVFSPIFTSGKMKLMMGLMTSLSVDLEREVARMEQLDEDVELKELFARYSLDCMGSCVFGLELGALKQKRMGEESNKFVQYAAEAFELTKRDMAMFVASLVPGLGTLLKNSTIPLVKPKVTQFFSEVVNGTVDYRRETKTRRNDLIDLMLDALDESKEEAARGTKRAAEDRSVISTAIIFLMAGYDTTTLTLTHLVYEMAKNQEVQDTLLEEVDRVMASLPDGQDLPDYNQVQDMTFLDACLHETLRLHPIIESLTRDCTEDYKLKGCDLVIEKGTMVDIPTCFIHSDPKLYPEPERFWPERFLDGSVSERHKMAFLGFGVGPRNCIGGRFAMIEMKIGLVSLFSKHRFVRSAKTPERVTIHPTTVLAVPNHDMFVKPVPR